MSSRPKQLDEDLRYIQERGYTPVSAAELQAYVAGEGELPERPILITFDDGYKSSFVYAYPALKKYGMKGILAVIGIHSEYYSEIDDDNVNYAHATWESCARCPRAGCSRSPTTPTTCTRNPAPRGRAP